jgi:starch phosphorylase
VLDELASNRFCPKEPGLFSWIRDMLLSHDAYFVLGDFGAYADTQTTIAQEYMRTDDWTRKSVLNVARMGRFSSDRTVTEYAREIWHLERA